MTALDNIITDKIVQAGSEFGLLAIVGLVYLTIALCLPFIIGSFLVVEFVYRNTAQLYRKVLN